MCVPRGEISHCSRRHLLLEFVYYKQDTFLNIYLKREGTSHFTWDLQGQGVRPSESEPCQ